MTLTERELAEIDRANADERDPVVFVHGLWLLANSWEPWRELFEDRGYVTLAPGWPGDPATVAQARQRPDLLAGQTIDMVVDHHVEAIRKLTRKPAIIGHSFGGLFAQKLAGLGHASVSVAIDPAPFRGVLPLPIAQLRSAFPVLANPANRNRAVMLSYDQFRYAFANAVPEAEARQLYAEFPVPGPGAPLFQAATANLNPRTAAKVDSHTPRRGPLLIIGADADHTVPWSVSHAAYRKQRRNCGVTELKRLTGRGHSLVFDNGWRDVAEAARTFLARHY